MRTGWSHVEGSCEGVEVASLAQFVELGAYYCQMCWRRVGEWEKSVMAKEVDDGEEE